MLANKISISIYLPTLLLNKAEDFRTLLMWMYSDWFASSLWENHNE